MPTTQSGYPVIDSYDDSQLISNPAVPNAPGIRVLGGVRRGSVSTVLLYVASRWHTEVERLVQDQGVWGYEKRTIRQGTGWSNHSAGAAVDLNAARHPQGRAGTISSRQLQAVRSILSAVGTVVGWGGDFAGGSVDAMHWEIRANQAGGPVDRLCDLIRAGAVPNVPPALLGNTGGSHLPPKPPVSPPKGNAPAFPLPKGFYFGPYEGPAQSISGSGKNDARWRPFLLQWQLRVSSLGIGIGKCDGYYGPKTQLGAKAIQARCALVVDGLIGPQTWKAAWEMRTVKL